MKHEYVDASDLIQTDMRSGNEKKLDAMLDERGANEMGAETAIVLRNIALELMAQLEQDEKTRPASDADMAVYHEISSNYNKDRSALAAQSHPRTERQAMNTTDKIMALITDFGAESLRLGSYERKDSYESSAKASWQTIALREKREAARQAVRTEIEALVRDAERYRHLRDGVLVGGELNEDMYVHVDHPSYPNRWALIGDELDEAVDAAMQEKQS